MKQEKKRVLVVDDEVGFTRLLKLNLEHSGEYEVQVVNQSLSAIPAARRFRPDIILLDVWMPGMDGGDLAGRIREQPSLKAIPIVFLTAAVKKDEVTDHDGYIGGLPFIAKPVDIFQLMRVIEGQLPASRPSTTSKIVE